MKRWIRVIEDEAVKERRRERERQKRFLYNLQHNKVHTMAQMTG